jgi:dUTP pyrophosphatase
MESVAVEIIREDDAADLPLPSYESEAASGMDVRAAVTEELVLAPGEIRLVPTGLRVAMPPGFELQVRPRSGLALKHGIIVVNSPGTVDADYRGPLGVILGNLGPEPWAIRRGDRIAQLVIQRVARAELRLVAALSETVRGEGGFGSSGVS